LDISQYSGEHIYRFPMPVQTPPMWLSLAGITHGDDCRQAADYTIIEYIFSGTGKLRAGEEVYTPVTGDICVVSGKTMYSAVADPADPWTKMEIHLKGTAAASFVQAFDLDRKILYENCDHLRHIFEEMFLIVCSDNDVEDIMEQCSMLLMKLLTGLSGSAYQEKTACDEVRAVKRFIDNNYHRELNMDDIAASVFRSKDYVQKQFKQVYGVTPYTYYMELKMECAKNLLQQTNLSVGQIAEKLGYKSDRYFSARFRSVTGITAGEFRKQNQER